MPLIILRLLVDFGLVVLIWLVQLTIYPSFKFYTASNLIDWHKIYTTQITFVVLPLMTGQLLLSGWQVYQTPSTYSIISILIVLILWISTFVIFVPLHNQIDADAFSVDTLAKLVNYNWLRTALWSLLFIYSLWEWINNH